jgi:hypothetical protein
MFPGLFNDCELYVNGIEAARRGFKEPWWLSNYRFEWDVALHDRPHQGRNAFALRCHNHHQMEGCSRTIPICSNRSRYKVR